MLIVTSPFLYMGITLILQSCIISIPYHFKTEAITLPELENHKCPLTQMPTPPMALQVVQTACFLIGPFGLVFALPITISYLDMLTYCPDTMIVKFVPCRV